MSYYVGDIPASPLVIEPARWTEDGEEPVDLTKFNTVTATLFGEDGTPVAAVFTGTILTDTISIEWPSATPFNAPGRYELRIVLSHSPAGVAERLRPVYLVADQEDGWHTLDSVRDDWPDAPAYDAWLYELLTIAKAQVLAYAPALVAGARPPLNYRQAQKMQARNIWTASKVDPTSGGLGEGSFVIQPHPLDWMIKQVLRPKTGSPVIG